MKTAKLECRHNTKALLMTSAIWNVLRWQSLSFSLQCFPFPMVTSPPTSLTLLPTPPPSALLQLLEQGASRLGDLALEVDQVCSAVCTVLRTCCASTLVLLPKSTELIASGAPEFVPRASTLLHELLPPLQANPTAPGAATATAAEDVAAVETKVVAIVRKLTGNSLVGPDSPFDTLGIDSLGAISLASQLRHVIGRTVDPTFVFEHRSARQIATTVASASAANHTLAEAVGVAAAAVANGSTTNADLATGQDAGPLSPAALPPLRCLVLHGDGGDAELMQLMLQGTGWLTNLSPQIEFVTCNAAHTCVPMPHSYRRLADAGIYDQPQYYAWRLSDPSEVAASLEHIMRMVDDHSPVDILCGICAGSTAAALFCSAHPSLVSGYLNLCGGPPSVLLSSSSHIVSDFLSVSVPSLHLISPNDDLYSWDQLYELPMACTHASVVVHAHGHAVPPSALVEERIAEFAGAVRKGGAVGGGRIAMPAWNQPPKQRMVDGGGYDSLALGGAQSGGLSNAGAGAGAGASTRPMQHLVGLRGIATAWIVFLHYAPRASFSTYPNPATLADAIMDLGGLMLPLFSVVGGFSMHQAHRGSDLFNAPHGTIASFLVDRLGRLLLMCLITITLCTALRALAVDGATIFVGTDDSPRLPNLSELVCIATAGLSAPWTGYNGCPNSASWYIGAVVPAWLLYPYVSSQLKARAPSHSTVATMHGLLGCVILLFVLSLVACFPMLSRIVMFFQNFPLLHPAAFFLGVLTAEIHARHEKSAAQRAEAGAAGGAEASTSADDAPAAGDEADAGARWLGASGWQRACACFADVSVAIFFYLVLSLARLRMGAPHPLPPHPPPPTAEAPQLNAHAIAQVPFAPSSVHAVLVAAAQANDWYFYDPNILGQLFTPLYCAFVYGSAAGGGAGLSAALLRQPWLIGVGEHALAVYLWAESAARVTGAPYNAVFMTPGRVAFGVTKESTTGQFALLLALLWTAAAVYTDIFEARAVPWLRARLLPVVTRFLAWGSDEAVPWVRSLLEAARARGVSLPSYTRVAPATRELLEAEDEERGVMRPSSPADDEATGDVPSSAMCSWTCTQVGLVALAFSVGVLLTTLVSSGLFSRGTYGTSM